MLRNTFKDNIRLVAVIDCTFPWTDDLYNAVAKNVAIDRLFLDNIARTIVENQFGHDDHNGTPWSNCIAAMSSFFFVRMPPVKAFTSFNGRPLIVGMVWGDDVNSKKCLSTLHSVATELYWDVQVNIYCQDVERVRTTITSTGTPAMTSKRWNMTLVRVLDCDDLGARISTVDIVFVPSASPFAHASLQAIAAGVEVFCTDANNPVKLYIGDTSQNVLKKYGKIRPWLNQWNSIAEVNASVIVACANFLKSRTIEESATVAYDYRKIDACRLNATSSFLYHIMNM